MNRRDLFKFAGLGAAALLVPTTYFLPPSGGWIQRLKIRKTEQYLINLDAMAFRYDAAWDTPSGPKQCYVMTEPEEVFKFPTETRDWTDKIASKMLRGMMEKDGGTANSSAFKLELPKNIHYSGYIYA